MVNGKYLKATLIIIIAISGTAVFAEKFAEYNVMLIVDGSHRMNQRWEKTTRIDALKDSMKIILEEIAKDPEWGYNMGIRLFGDQTPLNKGDCADLRLGAPIEWFNPHVIGPVIQGLKPQGRTCLAHGIYSAQDDFKDVHRNSFSSIVVIASAADDCNISEFDALKYVKEERKAVQAIHIIGLDLKEPDEERLRSVAQRAEGYFVNVKKVEELTPELMKVLNSIARGRITLDQTAPVEQKPTDASKP